MNGAHFSGSSSPKPSSGTRFRPAGGDGTLGVPGAQRGHTGGTGHADGSVARPEGAQAGAYVPSHFASQALDAASASDTGRVDSRRALVNPGANAVRQLLMAVLAFLLVLLVQYGSTIAGTVGLTVAYVSSGITDTTQISQQIVGPILIISQVSVLVVFLPWWLHVRPVSVLRGRPKSERMGAGRIVLSILAILVLGIGLQLLVSYALTIILPHLPDLQQEYTEMMDDSVTSELSVLSVVVSAIGAPITEELACRGVILEYALRAFNPTAAVRWKQRRRQREGADLPLLSQIPPARFWAANIVQALLFGVLHMNLVQGVYAFAVGLVFGWVDWRAGSLVPSILTHLSVNLAMFFVSDLSGLIGAFGLYGGLAVSAVIVAAALAAFAVFSRRKGVKRVSPEYTTE